MVGCADAISLKLHSNFSQVTTIEMNVKLPDMVIVCCHMQCALYVCVHHAEITELDAVKLLDQNYTQYLMVPVQY